MKSKHGQRRADAVGELRGSLERPGGRDQTCTCMVGSIPWVGLRWVGLGHKFHGLG